MMPKGRRRIGNTQRPEATLSQEVRTLLTLSEREQFDALCKQFNCTRSHLLRRLVCAYINSQKAPGK